MHIETSRLLIRGFTEEDAPSALNYLSDPQVMAFIQPPFNAEETRHFIQHHGLKTPPDVYAVEEKSSGKLVGHVIFHPFESESDLEIGWIFDRQFWRKGYAQECTKALLEYAFLTLSVKEVIAEVDEKNLASKKTIQQAGFIFRATQGDLEQWVIDKKQFTNLHPDILI